MSQFFFNFDQNRWRPRDDSRASCDNRAWQSTRPRAWAVVVGVAGTGEVCVRSKQGLQRAAGEWGNACAGTCAGSCCSAWGTRRPSGGRGRDPLTRARRSSQPPCPESPLPDPNQRCLVVIDYVGDGVYAMTAYMAGAPPDVIASSSSPVELIYAVAPYLQPGLTAYVSETAMLCAMLSFAVWSPREFLDDGFDLGCVNRTEFTQEERAARRVAEFGYSYTAISRAWSVEIFGPFLSREERQRLRERGADD